MIQPLAVGEALERGWPLPPSSREILTAYEHRVRAVEIDGQPVDVVDRVMGFGGLEEQALVWLNVFRSEPGTRWGYWEGDLVLMPLDQWVDSLP